MANNGPDSGDDDERNPFIAFRRFVDEQMSLMVRTMRNLPSAFPEIRKEMGEVQRDAFDAWKRFNDGYERSMNPERRKTEMRPGEKEYLERLKAEQERQKEERPNQEQDDKVWCPWIPFDHQPGPNFRRHKAGFASPFWQPRESWVRNSTYSPLQLEQDEMLDGSGVKWREAFEDLLQSQEDGPLPDRNQPTEQSAEDWLSSLKDRRLLRPNKWPSKSPYDDFFADQITRRIFGSLAPVFEHTPTEESEDRKESPNTELDIYEQFLGRDGQVSRVERHQHTEIHEQSTYTKEENDDQQNQVVSSYSTTEQRYLPDGSVETTKIKKVRFADGTEENEETRTVKPPQQTPRPAVEENANKTVEDSGKPKTNSKKSEKEKSSWFWSS